MKKSHHLPMYAHQIYKILPCICNQTLHAVLTKVLKTFQIFWHLIYTWQVCAKHQKAQSLEKTTATTSCSSILGALQCCLDCSLTAFWPSSLSALA